MGSVFQPISRHATHRAFPNEYLYTGRRLDPATELQLNRNRFYVSHLGRWVNRDPVRYLAGSNNLYEYVGGTPTDYSDPLGLIEEGGCCTPPAPGFPNVYFPTPTGILHGTGGSNPTAVDNLFQGIDDIQILLDIIDIVNIGGAGVKPGKGSPLWKIIQELIIVEGMQEQVSPNDSLIDISQELLDHLGGELQRNNGFTLWVEVEFYSCVNNRWEKATDQVMYDSGNAGVFGGALFPTPTFDDIRRAIENALREIDLENRGR
ncbi:RHS repeat-associated core domain-containing protein [Adhaeretor mobilis]|uniref:RHS repeat-associated core domain-containing protein n=1 Tax=Adhaeretor mobilis TaxID=1930276 RepID=A0A517N0J2_9BACT|nr:RHS repeat-associated core domain-containing protein [Adhaeretor mobilis]QDT00624.1 hypothetical protein HG15A2_39630 [Adhaeretor mobilis]